MGASYSKHRGGWLPVQIPAARCNVDNTASQLTLQRAGFVPCGNMVTGTLKETFGNDSN